MEHNISYERAIEVLESLYVFYEDNLKNATHEEVKKSIFLAIDLIHQAEWESQDINASTKIRKAELHSRRIAGSTYEISRTQEVLNAYRNGEDIDEDTYIQADTEVEFSNGFTETVDTIFLVYEPRYDKYPRFKGFAHTPKGGYDWDYVDAYDITNFDLDEYMDGINIIDLEKMLEDHPEIFDIR